MNMTQKQLSEDILAFLGKLKKVLLEAGEEHGVTPIQLSALYGINRTGELPMGQFASVLHCDPSNVTGIVDRLVSQKLVVRRECAQDRRSKLLALTPEGKAIVEELEQELPGRIGCNVLSGAQCGELHTLLQKIIKA